MKILWLINVPLPEASILMGEAPSPFGGWLIESSKILSESSDICLSIAFPIKNKNGKRKLEGDKINYFPFILTKDNKKKTIKDNSELDAIIEQVEPDIVHIYGTELPHSIAMVNTCKRKAVKVVISIQGLVSIYAKHILAGLPFNIIYGVTLRNLVARDSVWSIKRTLERRGKNEIDAIRNVNHVIGRTTWDKACTLQINPDAKYHFCNETLRSEFYTHQWHIEGCDKNTIFLSQGQYPIKGLHYVIEAMKLIIKRFPEAKLYVGGKDISKKKTIKNKLLMTYYGKYINKNIRKLGMEDNIIFTGPLDERRMCERYLASNVFVCPSTIENSPNSLGEAMILGVPCIASDVGGISDMLKNKEEGFVYPADAPYMLAYYICEIFENKGLALRFSRLARERALKTHDKKLNLIRLLEIYNEIINGQRG